MFVGRSVEGDSSTAAGKDSASAQNDYPAKLDLNDRIRLDRCAKSLRYSTR